MKENMALGAGVFIGTGLRWTASGEALARITASNRAALLST